MNGLNGMMRLKIGDGVATDIYDMGFHLIKSQEVYGQSIKKSNIVTTDFPEEDGVRVYIPDTPKKQAIDYTVKLAYYDEAGDAPQKIREFIDSMLGKDIVIYNDYKGVQLNGKYKSYKDGGTHDGTKVALFDVTFLIPNPNEIINL